MPGPSTARERHEPDREQNFAADPMRLRCFSSSSTHLKQPHCQRRRSANLLKTYRCFQRIRILIWAKLGRTVPEPNAFVRLLTELLEKVAEASTGRTLGKTTR